MEKSEVIAEIQADAQKNYLDFSEEEKNTLRSFVGTEEAILLRKLFPEIVAGLTRLRTPEGVSVSRRGLATR